MTGKTVSLALLLGMMGGLTAPAQAVKVNFQGALVEALPCTIDNDQPIDVDFGDSVIIRNLDGVRYSQPIPYQVECSDTGSARLRIVGTPASFGVFLLQTSLPGLGIRITLDGNPYPIGTNGFLTGIDVQSLPQLIAVPVVNPAQPPVPGAFTARATLLADYQ